MWSPKPTQATDEINATGLGFSVAAAPRNLGQEGKLEPIGGSGIVRHSPTLHGEPVAVVEHDSCPHPVMGLDVAQSKVVQDLPELVPYFYTS